MRTLLQLGLLTATSLGSRRRRLSFALPASLLTAVLAVAAPVQAQTNWVTGYYQNVPLGSSKTELSDGGVSDFNRFRLTTEPTFGQFSLEAAYEQAATFRQNAAIAPVGLVPDGGEWLNLQWTIADEDHVLWRHRFDRLSLTWRPTDNLELSAGRQAVSWATTLFLTPADPFSPFDPADPFRVFRAGVDTARVRFYPNALSEIDVVVRPTKNEYLGEELTVLARGLTVLGGWEISGWGGSLYGDGSFAFATAGSAGAFALRGEGVVRRIDTETVFRGSIGIDRYLSINGNDTHLLFEYQYDGLAATGAAAYPQLFRTDPFLRGELQVLGRHETAVQGSYQLTPLWTLAAMWLWNLSDKSTLVSPSFSYSLSDEASIMGGMFFGFGASDPTQETPLPSEYGAAGTTAFVSVSFFF